MRKMTLFFVAFSFAFLPSLFAQQKNEFSIFVTDWEYGRDRNGTYVNGGGGMAFDRFFTPRVSAQFSIATERHHTHPYVVNPDGSLQQVTSRAFRVYPIDVAVRYHFLNETRWKPYLGVGARYVGAPQVGSEFRYQNHFGPEIIGGTVFQIKRSLGIVLDGKFYFGDREHYDNQFRPSLGLNWRF